MPKDPKNKINSTVDEQKKQIDEQRKRIDEQTAAIKRQEAAIAKYISGNKNDGEDVIEAEGYSLNFLKQKAKM